jgi:hypothetical protein
MVATFSAEHVSPAKVAQTAEADRQARDPENS